MEGDKKCIKCKKSYDFYMFENYNLDLCPECYNKLEKENKIYTDEMVDDVTHVITCPLCKAKYGFEIVDKQCKTKGCKVSFFISCLDHSIIARWID